MNNVTPLRTDGAEAYCREVELLIQQIGQHAAAGAKRAPDDLMERIDTALEADCEDPSSFSARVALKRAVRASGIR
jgi:hypothetical protein